MGNIGNVRFCKCINQEAEEYMPTHPRSEQENNKNGTLNENKAKECFTSNAYGWQVASFLEISSQDSFSLNVANVTVLGPPISPPNTNMNINSSGVYSSNKYEESNSTFNLERNPGLAAVSVEYYSVENVNRISSPPIIEENFPSVEMEKSNSVARQFYANQGCGGVLEVINEQNADASVVNLQTSSQPPKSSQRNPNGEDENNTDIVKKITAIDIPQLKETPSLLALASNKSRNSKNSQNVEIKSNNKSPHILSKTKSEKIFTKTANDNIIIDTFLIKSKFSNLRDDDVVFHGILYKLTSESNLFDLRSFSFAKKFCLLTKKEFSVYQTKESYLSMLKPLTVVQLHSISEISSLSTDFFRDIVIKNNNYNNMFHFTIKSDCAACRNNVASSLCDLYQSKSFISDSKDNLINVNVNKKKGTGNLQKSPSKKLQGMLIFSSDSQQYVSTWISLIKLFTGK